MSHDELAELLRSIGQSMGTLTKLDPHKKLVKRIKAVLADIQRAGQHVSTQAILDRLDDYEAQLTKLLTDSQDCQCDDCNKTEAA